MILDENVRPELMNKWKKKLYNLLICIFKKKNKNTKNVIHI